MLCKLPASTTLPARRRLLEPCACLGLQLSQISLHFRGHTTSGLALSSSDRDLVAVAPPASTTTRAVLSCLRLHASSADVSVDSGDAQSSHRSREQLALRHHGAPLVHHLGRVCSSCYHARLEAAEMVVLNGSTWIHGTRREVKDRIVILEKKPACRVRRGQRMACKSEDLIIAVMGSRLVLEGGVLNHSLVGMR